MTQGNGSDQTAMEYGLEYNPPMNSVTGERNLKEAKMILDNLGGSVSTTVWFMPRGGER